MEIQIKELILCDITMCCNCNCPLKAKCYRYRAIPDQYWQSFCLFKPKDKPFGGYGDKVLECDHFWEINEAVDRTLSVDVVDNRYERDEKWEGIK